jgi:hypothetical protein
VKRCSPKYDILGEHATDALGVGCFAAQELFCLCLGLLLVLAWLVGVDVADTARSVLQNEPPPS